MAELDNVQDGVENGTSTGEAASTATPEQGRQTDWNQDPKFKEWQSKADKRISQAERMAAEERNARLQLEQQYHQDRMNTLPDGDKVLYQNQLLTRQLQELQRQRDLDAYAIQRQRDLDDIIRKTGVPLEQIENASNVHEAWQIGYDFREKNGTGQRSTREEEIERRADNTVDIGGGKATGKSAVIQAKYDTARKQYDMRGQFEAMAEADAAGVAITEW